ncbi:hypothetical protein [Bacteroides acidifaciens]|uniref:hypothetical protein n=1 Tax=Bacteroides acidifaciens TaxID=85831 RepID=UPI00263B233E|nr:hypothetical protein [Bacteroides acidifaciens]
MTTEQSIRVAKDMINKMVDQCELENYTIQDLQILLTYCDTALDISFDHSKYTLNQADVYSNNDFSGVYMYYWMYGGWSGHCIDATENLFTFRYERKDRAMKLMKRQIAPQEPDEYFMDHLAWIVLETRALDNENPLKISFASWPIENVYRDKTIMPMIRVLKFSMMYCLYLIGIGSVEIGKPVEFENDDQMTILFEDGIKAYMDKPMSTYFAENGWDNDRNLKEMYKIHFDMEIVKDPNDERYTTITNYIANKRKEQTEAKRNQLQKKDKDDESDHRPIIIPPTNGPKGTVIALSGDENNMSQVSKLLSEILGIATNDERHYTLIGGDTNNDEPATTGNTTDSNRPRRPSWKVVDQRTSNADPTSDMLDRIRDTVFGIVGVIKNTVRINWQEYRRIHDAIVDYLEMPYNEKEMNTVYGSEFISNQGLILSMSIVANKDDATNYAIYFDDPGYHVVRVKGPIAKTFVNKFSRNNGQKYPEFIICDIAGGSNFSLGDPRMVSISKNASEDKVHADGLLLVATAFAVIYSEKMNQIRILTPNMIINENTFDKLLNFCETGGIFTSRTMVSRTLSLVEDIINEDLTSYKNNVKYTIGEFYIYMETPTHDFVWDHEGLEWMVDPRGGDESLFGYGARFALYRDYYKVESDSPYYSSYGVYRDLRKILRYMLTTMKED